MSRARQVRRITLNRPEKRNPLSNELRTELFHALEAADQDEYRAGALIIRGAGSVLFCRLRPGVQRLAKSSRSTRPAGLSNWPRHVVEGFFRMWDMAKPIIAQVHGYCLAGGTELATACDLVYVAEDAKIGYPVVRYHQPARQPVLPVDRRPAPRHGAHAHG